MIINSYVHCSNISVLETCHRTISIDGNVFVFDQSGLKRIDLAVKFVGEFMIRFSIMRAVYLLCFQLVANVRLTSYF